MKKIIFIAIIALFLVGCSGSKETTTNNPFSGGSDGLSVSFVEGAPPSEVFDNNDFKFDIEVQLENKGEADVASNDIIVKIEGINSEEFGVSSLIKNAENDIKGAEKDSTNNRIEGDIGYVLFQDLSYENNIVGASLTRPIIATVCYEYETKSITDVCVLNDVAKDDSSVCTVNGNKNSYSSSGPVQVTSFVEKSAGTDKVEFQFTIQSSANIFESGSECSSDRTKENVVDVSVDSGISGLKCSGLRGGSDTEGKVTLREGSYTIRCTQEMSSDNDYETSVNIAVNYAVKDSIKKEIVIKQS